VTGEDLVRQALNSRESLRTEATHVGGKGQSSYKFYRRALRYLKGIKDGRKLIDAFLSSSARYEMHAAGRMVAPRDQVLDLVADHGVPLTWLSETAERKRSTYGFWYNRLLNKRPGASSSRRITRHMAPGASWPVIEGASKSPHDYFEVTDDEFTS
jgi:hypothetical protein